MSQDNLKIRGEGTKADYQTCSLHNEQSVHDQSHSDFLKLCDIWESLTRGINRAKKLDAAIPVIIRNLDKIAASSHPVVSTYGYTQHFQYLARAGDEMRVEFPQHMDNKGVM